MNRKGHIDPELIQAVKDAKGTMTQKQAAFKFEVSRSYVFELWLPEGKRYGGEHARGKARPKVEVRPPCRFSDQFIKTVLSKLEKPHIPNHEVNELLGCVPAMLRELLEIRQGTKITREQPKTQLVGMSLS